MIKILEKGFSQHRAISQILAYLYFISLTTCGDLNSILKTNKESHPYQSQLRCVRMPGSTVRVKLTAMGQDDKTITTFDNLAPMGLCELAIRASRNNQVCIAQFPNYIAFDFVAKKNIKNFGNNFEACTEFTLNGNGRKTQKGYMDFMSPKELSPFLAKLPKTQDSAFNAILTNPRTMWYDEASMIFSYQDSFGDPRGLRANRVGYDVGINADDSRIRRLVEFFKPGKFKFPFSIAAGVDFESNVYVLNFWLPPEVDNKVLPVKWWKNNSHWNWVFPVGTTIGEIMFMQAPDDKEWYPFEIRGRTRTIDSWTTSVWRPFVQASAMAQAIRASRSNWKDTDLKALVEHLENPDTLVSHVLPTGSYNKAIPDLKGAMDYLPSIKDFSLIKEFLSKQTYASAVDQNWKVTGTLQTFAASTQADFHIVPKGYIGGLLKVNDADCNRCHDQTSRPLNNLHDDVVLYGEVWGEDQVFTWHPFEITTDAFTVSDGSRFPNKRMITAELIVNEKPTPSDKYYKELSRPYKAIYE